MVARSFLLFISKHRVPVRSERASEHDHTRSKPNQQRPRRVRSLTAPPPSSQTFGCPPPRSPVAASGRPCEKAARSLGARVAQEKSFGRLRAAAQLISSRALSQSCGNRRGAGKPKAAHPRSHRKGGLSLCPASPPNPARPRLRRQVKSCCARIPRQVFRFARPADRFMKRRGCG